MKNKLSPLESLRAEKLRLKQECEAQEARIMGNLSYAKDHFGSLMLSSVFPSSSSKSKFSAKSLLSGLVGSSFRKGNSRVSPLMFFNKLPVFVPILWDIAQPVLIAMATKKVKNLIFGSKKKKKKK